MTTFQSVSWFNKDSKRAIVGLKFQDSVFQDLLGRGIAVRNVGEWLLSFDPQLRDNQIWMLEKIWGDLVCTKPDGTLLFIECITASQEETIFPMSKLQFEGKNKWYLFGWDECRYFVPSRAWNAYVKKIDRVSARDHDVVAKLRRSQYASMRCGISGIDEFLKSHLQ